MIVNPKKQKLSTILISSLLLLRLSAVADVISSVITIFNVSLIFHCSPWVSLLELCNFNYLCSFNVIGMGQIIDVYTSSFKTMLIFHSNFHINMLIILRKEMHLVLHLCSVVANLFCIFYWTVASYLVHRFCIRIMRCSGIPILLRTYWHTQDNQTAF